MAYATRCNGSVYTKHLHLRYEVAEPRMRESSASDVRTMGGRLLLGLFYLYVIRPIVSVLMTWYGAESSVSYAGHRVFRVMSMELVVLSVIW